MKTINKYLISHILGYSTLLDGENSYDWCEHCNNIVYNVWDSGILYKECT